MFSHLQLHQKLMHYVVKVCFAALSLAALPFIKMRSAYNLFEGLKVALDLSVHISLLNMSDVLSTYGN